MTLPINGSTHLIPAYYSFYRPRKDERPSWPSWPTCSGWFTHISGHPSAAGRAQDRESSPVRDRRSTTCYVATVLTAKGRIAAVTCQITGSRHTFPILHCGPKLPLLLRGSGPPPKTILWAHPSAQTKHKPSITDRAYGCE